ncbi:hypothetical protein MACK_003032 [Theileria orientalis]|uniref:Uncharacterized protein n=1 Tax=Theileria orientalis TaxID=68886 RepID=A0A976MEI0_THEOR|nr:hypothetical protein MACK_003032 [Theileria orientalis]
MASAQPGGKDNDTMSISSTSTAGSFFSSIIPTSIKSSNITANSVILDFDASEVSPDLTVSTSIPGVIKYAPANNKKLDKISGNSQELEFTNEIDHVFCNSPFNGNITVVFKDATTEQYFLQQSGFVKVTPSSQKSSSQNSAVPDAHTLLDLDLKNPSNQFAFEQVGNIKCYKPKGPRELVSKIIIDDFNRNVEHHVKENFICFTEVNGKYSILVAYFNTDNKWLKYTLSKHPNSNILMDVSLIRDFDDIDMATIFADHSTPYDNEVFLFENLKVNKTDVGKMISQNTGNLKFFLDVRDQGGKTERIDIVFEKHFLIDEGFKFHSIRSKSNYEQMMFTYVNDNVVRHEKFIKKGNVYKKDLNAVNKHDLNRTKTIIGRQNFVNENVLFYTTIVPDGLHQEIAISHHGRYKVLDFAKGKDRFVIFPNLEFYLSKDEDHRLILCENGESVNLVMKTITDSKRVDFIASTDPLKGNPLAIKAMLKDFDFSKLQTHKSTAQQGQEPIQSLQGGVQPAHHGSARGDDDDDDDIQVVEGPPLITPTQPVVATHQIPASPVTTQTQVTPTPPTAPMNEVDDDDDLAVVEGPMIPATSTPQQPKPQQQHQSQPQVQQQQQSQVQVQTAQQQQQNQDNDDDLVVIVGPPPIQTQQSQPADKAQVSQPANPNNESENEMIVIEGPPNVSPTTPDSQPADTNEQDQEDDNDGIEVEQR